MDFLQYREKLKEELRAKMRKEQPSLDSRPQINETQEFVPFGSFFGPSDRSIAPRLLKETISLGLETHLPSSTTQSPPPGITDKKKPKNQILKENRDYSFLFDDSKESDQSTIKSAVTEKPKKIPQAPSDNRQPKTKNTSSSSTASRKLPPKKVAASPSVTQKIPQVASENTQPKSSTTSKKLPSAGTKKVSSFSVMEKKTYSLPNTKLQKREVDRPKKRPAEDDDPSFALAELRKITGYNPCRYRGMDYDDRNMVAGFADVQNEERRSAKIARKEDAEEARRNEEIERREKLLRKKAKRES
ncbi:hypothetical protein ACHQM5_002925 [Ranunculus cassubicifolius]